MVPYFVLDKFQDVLSSDRIEINIIDLAYNTSEYIYDYDPFDATLKYSFINKILLIDHIQNGVKWIVPYISQLLFIALCVLSFAIVAVNILSVSNMDKISKSFVF